jgi:hypothetical protein
MSERDGSDHTLAGPDEVESGGTTPPAQVEESDPNADSREGLAGDMGVSSERRGVVRGVEEEVTYGMAPTHPDEEPGEAPPEQSAYDGRPEVNPASPGAHPSDPDSNPGHGI